jgi:hypothetical protein
MTSRVHCCGLAARDAALALQYVTEVAHTEGLQITAGYTLGSGLLPAALGVSDICWFSYGCIWLLAGTNRQASAAVADVALPLFYALCLSGPLFLTL